MDGYREEIPASSTAHERNLTVDPSDKDADENIPPIGDDQQQNEQLNEEAAAKLREAEERIKEAAHDVERDLK